MTERDSDPETAFLMFLCIIAAHMLWLLADWLESLREALLNAAGRLV